MDAALQEKVWSRAKSQCEYCQFPYAFAEAPFEIDHIVARKHGGETVAVNLALSCYFCNSYKGSNIAGIDPKSRKLIRLFNPRRDEWKAHFLWNDVTLVGRTAVGRATIRVLRMNDPSMLSLREMSIELGIFLPNV